MREIKFRAWGIPEKKMYGWSSLLEDDLPSIFNDRAGIELMQFTGLKDKNGKEIYEGDIIHATSPAITADISVNGEEEELYDFEATDAKTLVTWNHEFARWDGIPFLLGDDPRFIWQVIGNIYENPELIK